jgi:hypothetical protein
MKIGAADCSELDLNDGIPKVDDFRIGNIFDPDLSLAIPTNCSHKKTLLKVFSETLHRRSRPMRPVNWALVEAFPDCGWQRDPPAT